MGIVELLQELVRIDTTNPPGNEGPAAELLHSHLTSGGLKSDVFFSPEGRPSVVARIPGPPNKRALVLLSHLDVVGVEADKWRHDPFGGEIHDGFLWGRGTLDMKGIGAMHAHAAMQLVGADVDTDREVIVVSVADEEAGGKEGARWLVADHPEAVGFGDSRPPPEVIGEGAFGLVDVLDRPLMPIVLGEKTALWLNLHAHGDPGHGAMPPKDQAVLNLTRAVMLVAGFAGPRVHPVMKEQFKILATELPQPLATVFKVLGSGAGNAVARALKGPLAGRTAIAALLSDTVSTTQLSGGYKHNVVPGTAGASLDCRLLPDTDPDAFTANIRRKLARLHVDVEEVGRNSGPVSDPGDLWPTLVNASNTLEPNAIVVPSITAGITDVRYFRSRGAIGYGWVPLMLTPDDLTLIHGHNERINVQALERAGDAMATVARSAAGGSEVRR